MTSANKIFPRGCVRQPTFPTKFKAVRLLCMVILTLLTAMPVLRVQAEGFTSLHQFTGYVGSRPTSLIEGSDGNFYGTATGGASGAGEIFKRTSSGTFTAIHAFSATDSNGFNTDGADPAVALVQGSDGNFYGTAQKGGAHGNGTIFKITPAGAFTLLHTFSATDGSGSNSDGKYPLCPLLHGSDGNFYGTASYGGASGDGTVFRMTATGTLTTLASFSESNDGLRGPAYALLQGKDGNFYGITAGNSHSSGAIFKMTSSGTITVLYYFSPLSQEGGNDDGADPDALVQGPDGTLYGTTVTGGRSDNEDEYGDGQGTVFKVTAAGDFTSLLTFDADSDDDTYNGAGYPTALILAKDGNFYGTATAEGSAIFRITPAGRLTVLEDFDGSADGQPASLIQGIDGNFYGVTQDDTTASQGTIFKYSPSSNTITSLYNFGESNLDGAGTVAALVLGTDGNCYGTAPEGGASNCGTVFKVTPAGAFTVLHSFSGASDGSDPEAALVT